MLISRIAIRNGRRFQTRIPIQRCFSTTNLPKPEEKEKEMTTRDKIVVGTVVVIGVPIIFGTAVGTLGPMFGFFSDCPICGFVLMGGLAFNELLIKNWESPYARYSTEEYKKELKEIKKKLNK